MNKNFEKAVDLFVRLAQEAGTSEQQRLPEIQKALKDFLGLKIIEIGSNKGALSGEPPMQNCPAIVNYVNPAMDKAKADNIVITLQFSPSNFSVIVSTKNAKVTQILNAPNNLAGAINQEIIKAVNDKKLKPPFQGNTVDSWNWLTY